MMAGSEISNYLQENLLFCHNVNCNFHMDVLRLKPVSSSKRPANKCLNYGITSFSRNVDFLITPSSDFLLINVCLN